MENDSGSQNDYAGRLEEIQAELSKLMQLADDSSILSDPRELEEFECEVGAVTRRLAGLITGMKIQKSLDSGEIQEASQRFMKAWDHPMRHDGKERVRVRTKSGQEVEVNAPYFRRKGKRKYKKRYHGVYPGLVLLGIHDRCTPGLASDVSLLAAALSSLDEAGHVLEGIGIHLDIKTIRSITYAFASSARLIQQSSVLPIEDVSGRRVVVSCDGGRVRIRTDKRGRKTKKKRCRYRTDWREPKLLIIYVVDGEGRKEHGFPPVIDGTLKGPDALFSLLGYYLLQLRIDQADRILFVADGAPWIWNRLKEAVSGWGVKSDQVIELVDFFHAVEHLGKVANLRKSWTVKKRKQWVTRHRRLLLKGQVDQVINAVRAICRGRNSREIRTQRDYFIKNAKRMGYASARNEKMPIGSGAVESAIRRVVNLRLKGAGIYWLEESAEAMLLLRSYFKAGRWNLLKEMAIPTFSASCP